MGVYPLESPLTQAIRRARLYREGRIAYLFVRQQVQDDFDFRVAEERTRSQDLTGEGQGGPGLAEARRLRLVAAGHASHRSPTSFNASALDEGAEGPPVSFARRQEGQTGPVLVVRADAGPTNFDKGGNDG